MVEEEDALGILSNAKQSKKLFGFVPNNGDATLMMRIGNALKFFWTTQKKTP